MGIPLVGASVECPGVRAREDGESGADYTIEHSVDGSGVETGGVELVGNSVSMLVLMMLVSSTTPVLWRRARALRCSLLHGLIRGSTGTCFAVFFQSTLLAFNIAYIISARQIGSAAGESTTNYIHHGVGVP